MKRPKHVLILEGYCKQCLPFIRGFKELGCEVTVLCGSRLDCSYASRLPDYKILGVCDFARPEESERYIVDLVKTGRFDIVFPPFDFSARILSHHKQELSAYAYICANDADVFDRANDKNEVMRVCAENGLPCPRTVFGARSVADAVEKGLIFPAIIKPVRSFGARGFHIFQTPEEMERFVWEQGIDLEASVLQECIPVRSEVMTGTVYVDRFGEVKSSFLYVSKHLFPEDGGTSTMNVLMDRDIIHDTIATLVTKMGLRGVVGVDLMIDCRDNVAKVLEINPRAPHAITIGFLSGFNLAQQILEDACGQEVSCFDKTDTSLCVRIGQTDLLWFLSSPDRFRKSPRRMGYKRVREQMFFWDDPLPWFAFLLQGLCDFRQKMKEKKH